MNFLKIFDSKINIADDWIRTVHLWIRKQPLYQLRHTIKIILYLLRTVLWNQLV